MCVVSSVVRFKTPSLSGEFALSKRVIAIVYSCAVRSSYCDRNINRYSFASGFFSSLRAMRARPSTSTVPSKQTEEPVHLNAEMAEKKAVGSLLQSAIVSRAHQLPL